MIAISFKSRRYAPETRLAKIASKPPRTPSGSGSVPNPAHFLMLAFRDDQLRGNVISALFFISRHPDIPSYLPTLPSGASAATAICRRSIAASIAA